MKSSTRIDSVVFQLTPTRTRFDLVIAANGKTERIASGLLNPFLTHLKSAQEQIGKGGYSIILEPRRGSDAAWFTKGTVERFVRFVSTPEILERVYTIESEISQIAEAISFQSNNDKELHGQVRDHQVKYKESSEATSRKPNTCPDAVKSGNKAVPGSNDEKAIVLYKPDAPAPETDSSGVHAENSKTQLLRVLETRKSVLQKEQGMAFARAVAAGFDVDHIAPLMSFAECFGAARMMEACSRFVDLWKAKHKNGQWIEIEAVEEMSRADFASVTAFAIPNANERQKEYRELVLQGVMPSENNGASATASNADLKPQMDDHGASDTQEHLLGQFPHHPMCPPWPVHPQSSQMPLFPPYPLPMPYYQNYPGNGTFFQPPYPSVIDSGLHSGQIIKERKNLMDTGEMNTESDIQDIDTSKRAIYRGSDTDEDSESREKTKKSGKTARKQSGTVVIRNINYIASKKQNCSDSDSQSYSDSEDVDDSKTVNASTNGVKNKNPQRRSKRGAKQRRADDASKQLDKEDNLPIQAGDDGWRTFQNFLLQGADEDDNSGKSSMFAMEGKVTGKKRQAAVGDDPSILGRRLKDGEVDNHHDIRGDMTQALKPSGDRMPTVGGVNLGQSIGAVDSHLDIQFAEMGGRSIAYRRTAAASDDLMIHGLDSSAVTGSSSVVDQFGYRNVHKTSSSHNVADESFIVPCRSNSIDQVGDTGRTAIDMDSELPLALASSQNVTGKIGGEYNYEPYDLNMMPDRVTENGKAYHDPALDYELQAAKVDGKKKSANVKQGTKKVGNGQGLKSQKKLTAVTKIGNPSKLSPSEEARARAERLRSYKADLQKLKKAKEEEQIKRLEALKIERQKRIAARSSSGKLAQSPLASPQPKKLQPTKLSPTSHKGSKFSDTEPGSSSPLQRSTVKTISRLSGGANKNTRPGKLNFSSNSSGDRLTRSASSLREQKEENKGSTPDSKTSMAKIRRLSEPKSISYPASSVASPSENSLSRRTTKESEMRRTPATLKSEIIKSTSVTESNIKDSKGLSEVAQKKRLIKEPTQKMNRKSASNASASLTGGGDQILSQNDYDGNTVVEKTVVVLECEKPSPIIQESEEKMHVHSLKSALDPKKGKSSEDVAVHPQISPSNMKEISARNIECQLPKASASNEAGAACAEKVLPNVSTINVVEKEYNAPYVRVSSMEDPCMEKSEYTKAPPSSYMATAGSELTTARVSSSMSVDVSNSRQQKLDKIWENSEKPTEKESSKGLKRLLKFGRKKHISSASESNQESDLANPDGSVATSSEVTTLKSLLSEGEGSSAHTTPHKSSRSFSLLSQFRIKSSEKKLST